jgi:hypothetical protein
VSYYKARRIMKKKKAPCNLKGGMHIGEALHTITPLDNNKGPH